MPVKGENLITIPMTTGSAESQRQGLGATYLQHLPSPKLRATPPGEGRVPEEGRGLGGPRGGELLLQIPAYQMEMEGWEKVLIARIIIFGQ